MENSRSRIGPGTIVVAVALALPLNAAADAAYDALKSQVETLQKQLQQVQETLKQYEAKSASQEDVEKLKQEVAEASAASAEWKNADSFVHLAGYGDATYSDAQHQNGGFSGVRFNPIFHYQYKDLVMLESEVELSVDKEGETSTDLEYMTLDYFANDYLAIISGKFLSPVGYFRQNLHPSWINKLPTAPPGFGHNPPQAAPVSDVGVEARGGFPLGADSRFMNYGVYVANGPVLDIEDGEITEIKSEGQTSNEDGKFVGGGRVGFLPIPMLEVGLSGAAGKVAGADEPSATRDYDVYGADFSYKWRDRLGLRSEYIKQKVGTRSSSEAPDAASWSSWYTQVAYQFAPTKWEGVVRYTDYNSHINEDDQKQWALGINYLFAANAMAKFAYDFNDGNSGSSADDNDVQLQFSYGF